MEKEKLEDLLIDYLDGRLDSANRDLVEQEVSRNAESKKLLDELREVTQVIKDSADYEPPTSLRRHFDKLLEEELGKPKKSKTLFFNTSFYRIAAAVALIMLSGALGFWISKHQDQQVRMAQMEKEMEATRKQLADTRELMFSMLDNEQSASQRIKGVNVAMAIPEADNEIVSALFKTMLGDPNTNVRLAALEALSKFQDDPVVRKGLIEALSKQTDPMVQISLIQLMVQLNEKKAVRDLQRMVEDAETIKAVKDEAYSGIMKLS